MWTGFNRLYPVLTLNIVANVFFFLSSSSCVSHFRSHCWNFDHKRNEEKGRNVCNSQNFMEMNRFHRMIQLLSSRSLSLPPFCCVAQRWCDPIKRQQNDEKKIDTKLNCNVWTRLTPTQSWLLSARNDHFNDLSQPSIPSNSFQFNETLLMYECFSSNYSVRVRDTFIHFYVFISAQILARFFLSQL